MFIRSLLAAVVLIAGVVLSARFVLYDPANPGAERSVSGATLSKAPISLGNPAAAATLSTRLANIPGDEPRQPPVPFGTSLIIGEGDTLSEVLTDAGASRNDAAAAAAALGKLFNPRRIKPGQEITVTFMPQIGIEKAVGLPGRFQGFSLITDHTRIITVSRIGKGVFEASELKRHLTRDLVRAAGEIRSSLFVAATKAGMPATVLAELIHAYSWDVDFQRDIRSGDLFEIVFERFFDKDGDLVHNGRILYASLQLRGKNRPIYLHQLADGQSDYFDAKGRSARRTLMRTPIDGARLSSGFGKRRHPILGYMKQHRGVDFAAPRGTPIYAAGDGAVEAAGWNGAYGKYVRVRHNSEYKTAYAHMSRIKTRKGRRVRQGQVIGYVGTTGRSTGAHLHYEILKGNQRTNPLKVRMPSGRTLKGAELARLLETITKTDYQLAYLTENMTAELEK